MPREYVTSYCVLYDPYRCSIDPERIWGLIQGCGGGAMSSAAGAIDFYVPADLISIVLLMDGGLRIHWKKSYI
jgi:hypothetical protein